MGGGRVGREEAGCDGEELLRRERARERESWWGEFKAAGRGGRRPGLGYLVYIRSNRGGVGLGLLDHVASVGELLHR